MRRVGLVLCCVLAFVGCGKSPSEPVRQGLPEPQDLKVRSIVIVDKDGKERIRLGTREWWPGGPVSAEITLADGDVSSARRGCPSRSASG